MRWLHFSTANAQAVRNAWEKALQKIGHPTPAVDTSLRACALYSVAQDVIMSAPGWARSNLAERLDVPAKARASNAKLLRWVCDHWHSESVRSLVAAHVLLMVRMDVERLGGEEAAFQAAERDDWAWAFLVVGDDEALRARVRTRIGEDRWDTAEEELLREVGPNLWIQGVRPVLESVTRAYQPAMEVAALQRRVRELSWEAAESGERHGRATAQLAAARREIAELRAALAAETERARALEALLLEERRAWSELVRSLRSDRRETEDQPLGGKRVLIVGGDPVAAAGVALVERMGGVCEFVPGFEHEGRLAEAVAAADVVLAVVAHMSHKHSDIVGAEARRRSVPVVRINTVGATSLRRAIQEAVERVSKMAEV